MAEKGLSTLPNQEKALSLLEEQQNLADRIREGGKTSSAPNLKNIGKGIGEVYDNMSPLDKAALFTAPVPVVGDIVGGVADTAALIEDPSLTNAGLMALGLIPFVPSAGVTRTAQRAFTNLRNDIPGFYGTDDPIKQTIAAGKTLPEGVTTIARARYGPTARAIQDEYSISVADQKRLRMLLRHLRKSLMR